MKGTKETQGFIYNLSVKLYGITRDKVIGGAKDVLHLIKSEIRLLYPT